MQTPSRIDCLPMQYPHNELKAHKCDLIYLKNDTSGDHDNLAPILLPKSEGLGNWNHIFLQN
jgi:hypothetical protein